MIINERTRFSIGIVAMLMAGAAAWAKMSGRMDMVEKEQDGTRKLLTRMNKSLGRIEGHLGINPPADRDSD